MGMGNPITVTPGGYSSAASWAGPLAGGALSFAGDMLGGLLSASKSRKEAKRNRRFIEYMASTMYQRTMADMRKAGLNPILAYKAGTHGMTGGAQGQVPSMANIGSSAVSAGAKMPRASMEKALLTAQMDAAYATADHQSWAARHREEQAHLTRSQRPRANAAARYYQKHGDTVVPLQESMGVTAKGLSAAGTALRGLHPSRWITRLGK